MLAKGSVGSADGTTSRGLSLKFDLGGKEKSNRAATAREDEFKRNKGRAKFAGWQKRIGLGRAFPSAIDRHTLLGVSVGVSDGFFGGEAVQKCSGFKEHVQEIQQTGVLEAKRRWSSAVVRDKERRQRKASNARCCGGLISLTWVGFRGLFFGFAGGAAS
ncbi:hypothetical protein HC256_007699 [Beauveria bassiana]|nr:hypothetical protein HC256_007699 [Beauveria bassiana]